MADVIRGKLVIPKESRFEKLNNRVAVNLEEFNAKNFGQFLLDVFSECFDFMQKQNYDLPVLSLRIVYNLQEYRHLEKEVTDIATSEEAAINTSTAFVTNMNGIPTMYLNFDPLARCLEAGYSSFTLNLVKIFFHEMLHTIFPEKSEQKIFDEECFVVEKFLEFQLPEAFKTLKTADYYIKT